MGKRPRGAPVPSHAARQAPEIKEKWSPSVGRPHAFQSPPCLWRLRVLLALTCPARALFHALLPAAAVWAWVSLLGFSAARQRVSPLPPPP